MSNNPIVTVSSVDYLDEPCGETKTLSLSKAQKLLRDPDAILYLFGTPGQKKIHKQSSLLKTFFGSAALTATMLSGNYSLLVLGSVAMYFLCAKYQALLLQNIVHAVRVDGQPIESDNGSNIKVPSFNQLFFNRAVVSPLWSAPIKKISRIFGYNPISKYNYS